MILHRHEAKAPNPEEITETLKNAGLDKDRTLILGGGTLAIFGIRYAHDADVMIPRSTHTELLRSRTTPSGLPLQLKPHSTHGFLHAPPTKNPFLSLDIAPAYAHEDPDRMVDDEFLAFIEPLPRFDGYHHLTLDIVRAHKQHVGSLKHRHDVKLINNYLKGQKL
jgi:hypothetical protein